MTLYPPLDSQGPTHSSPAPAFQPLAPASPLLFSPLLSEMVLSTLHLPTKKLAGKAGWEGV